MIPRHSTSIVGIIFLILATIEVETSTVRCTLDDYTRPAGICGRALSSLLRTLCQHTGYNKRSTDMVRTYERLDAFLESTGVFSDDPMQRTEGQLAVSRAMSVKRFRRDSIASSVGVACECCAHRCDLSELMKYCRATPSST